MWAGVFLTVLLGPMLLGLINGNDNTIFNQLAVQSGVLATGVMVATVVAPSRMRSLTRALGIDGVLGVHRSLGLIVALLVMLHLILVLSANPAAVALIDPRQMTTPSKYATIATLALLTLVGLATAKQRFGHHYQLWRWLHIALAVVFLLASAMHIWMLGHLVMDPVLRLTFGLLAALLVAVLSYRWLYRPFLDRRDAYQVQEVRKESGDVHTLVIVPKRERHGAPGAAMRFEAGQFAWIRLRRAVTAEEHPFTISSSARDNAAVSFSIRGVGDFTRRIGDLRPGDPIWVDGPHGAFTWDERVRTRVLVLIAAGVGITPMMSMLRTLAHRGDRRPALLITGARTVDDLLFRDELSELREQLPLRVVEVLSSPPPGWRGRTGRVDRALLSDVLPEGVGRRKVEYFICGPPGMVTGVIDALDALGVDPSRVHTEQFDMV
jgi:predicted ferric reductase